LCCLVWKHTIWQPWCCHLAEKWPIIKWMH
jgi:hypothetical protein